ncbi:Protein O-linked-mannose beta-1,4-N-acetylglucosaminyltransferase 2 [Boothiomyces sp. JEL0838]|nr:Protein O-linked-mannose beta-1,4-N-acetylglucosaminyltransferase 2 [Boothiomyces sp. JEL0838]
MEETAYTKVPVDFTNTYLSHYNLHETSLPEPVDRLINHLAQPGNSGTNSLFYNDNRFPPSILRTKPRLSETPRHQQDNTVINSLKEENNSLNTKNTNLKIENQSLRDENTELNRKIEQLNANAELRLQRAEEEIRMDYNVEHYKNKELEMKIKDLTKSLDNSNHRLQKELEKSKQMELKLEELSSQHSKTMKANSLLVKRSKELDNLLESTHQNLFENKKEYALLNKWKLENEYMLDDYKNALGEAGLAHMYGSGGYSGGRTPLKDFLKLLKGENHELKAENKLVNRELKELKYELVTNSKSYISDMEKKETKLTTLEDQLRCIERLLEEKKLESSNLKEEKRQLCADKLRLENDKKRLIDETELKQFELLNRTNLQIKEIRENYESDKYDLRIAYDKLQEKNIELQAEIGQLIRDRRAATNSYYQRDPRINNIQSRQERSGFDQLNKKLLAVAYVTGLISGLIISYLVYPSRLSQLCFSNGINGIAPFLNCSSNLKLALTSGKANAHEMENEQKYEIEEDTIVQVMHTLPESSVYCTGSNFNNRYCRIRNLCYHPKQKDWFIVRTNRSIFENLPADSDRYKKPLLELSSIDDHPYFEWDYTEVSPFDENLRNVTVRYTSSTHFMFKRLHPLNIMHNLHDDVITRLDHNTDLPFNLNDHRIQFLDPYEGTESTRPFQYLSRHPLRFTSFLHQDDNILTCFRDAIVGNSQTTKWYQYGFIDEPQGPVKNLPNGLHVREVAEWIIKRNGLELGWDEKYPINPPILADKLTDLSVLDFSETDLIVILSRKSNRIIINEIELAEKLTDVFGYKTVFVRNEDYSFEEQIKILRKARIVIGMHGSILVMAMFCRRGTVLVEMFPYAVPSEDYTPYKTMAALPGMDLVYRAWEDTVVTVSEITKLVEEALLESRKRVLFNLYNKNYWAATIRPSKVREIECVEHAEKEAGTLWAKWKDPWGGVLVEKWSVLIGNDGKEYTTVSNTSSISIPGFTPGQTVRFYVRAISNKSFSPWSDGANCRV